MLLNVFAGRQRRMAEALSVNHSQISRVVGGKTAPGLELANALARLPGINPDWVRTGEGDPMLPTVEGTLPVALSVLPTGPEEHPTLLTGARHPVPAALSRPSRYWVEVQDSWPADFTGGLRLLPGDLLLMESDREWTSRPESVAGRLCGVRTAGPAFDLAGIGLDDAGLFVAYTYVAGAKPAATTPRPFRGRPRRIIRPLDDDETGPDEGRPPRPKARPPEPRPETGPVKVRPDADAIVCVCVYMARPRPTAMCG